MERTFEKFPVSKSLLTGLFAGMFATIACLIYNLVYRDETSFQLSDIINVSSLIFVVNFVFLFFGIIYYYIRRTFKKGDVIFIFLFVLLTILGIWQAQHIHRSPDVLQNNEFKDLLDGIIIIMGISSAFLIPVLFHSKKFEEFVL